MNWLPVEQPPQDHEDVLIWRNWLITAVVGWYSPTNGTWHVYQVNGSGEPLSVCSCVVVDDVLAWLPIPPQHLRELIGGADE